MLASLSLETSDLKKIDYTNASVDRLLIHDHGRDYLKFSSVSFQELRRNIFTGIPTPDLLCGVFASITDKPNKGKSFKKYSNRDFCGWMCPEDYKYGDGECLTLYIRDSSANDIMREILTALSGQCWSERSFKLACLIEITLADGKKLEIEV